MPIIQKTTPLTGTTWKKPMAQKGFTMIELIIVIVIIGILAAVAIPRYVDMRQQARVAAVSGFTANLRAAASIAYANYQVNNSGSNMTPTILLSYMTDTGGAVASGANTINATVNGIGYYWTFTSPAVVSTQSPTT